MLPKIDKAKLLFEGSYNYYNEGNKYSEEEFIVYRNDENGSIIYTSEVHTRVGTGEFLKVMCDYEVTKKWSPLTVKIEKSLGLDTTREMFVCNHNNNEMQYFFNDGEETHDIVRHIPNKFHIITPSFATTMLCTYQNKLSSMGRNPYIMIGGKSDWDFVDELDLQTVYLEVLTHEKTELKINDQDLSCFKLNLFANDTEVNVVESPAEYYISRHYGIPYLMKVENIEIKIQKMKKYENFYQGMY